MILMYIYIEFMVFVNRFIDCFGAKEELEFVYIIRGIEGN